METIEILNCYPDLQLQYIETLLVNEKKNSDEVVSENLKLIFIDLYCRLSPNKVVQQL